MEVTRHCCQTQRFGGRRNNRFGVEVVVLIVTCQGLLQGCVVGEGREGVEPGFRVGVVPNWGGETTEEFWDKARLKVLEGAKVGAAHVKCRTVHVHAKAEVAVNECRI